MKKLKFLILTNRPDPNKKTPQGYYQGGRTFKWTLTLKLFSKGDQLKVKLTNLKFPKTNHLG